MTKILLIVLIFVVSTLVAFKFTRSSFSDTESVLGNSIQVGLWGLPEPTPTPEVISTPTPTETPTPEFTPTPSG